MADREQVAIAGILRRVLIAQGTQVTFPTAPAVPAGAVFLGKANPAGVTGGL
jgi:hypothetical protein